MSPFYNNAINCFKFVGNYLGSPWNTKASSRKTLLSRYLWKTIKDRP